jgi:hypothetical protein
MSELEDKNQELEKLLENKAPTDEDVRRVLVLSGEVIDLYEAENTKLSAEVERLKVSVANFRLAKNTVAGINEHLQSQLDAMKEKYEAD